MNNGIIGKVLIALGVMVLLYAMNMPIAVRGSDIVNIHLISERQNTLILGGLAFIGGIILFAVAKLKQTGDEEAFERLRQIENREKAKQLLDAAAAEGATLTTKTLPQLWHRIFVGLGEGWSSLLLRLVAGLLIAYDVAESIFFLARNLLHFEGDIVSRMGNWVSILVLVYAFRNTKLLTVLKHVFVFGLVLNIGADIVAFKDGGMLTTLGYIPLVALIVGLISVLVIEWKQKKS